MCGRYAVYEIKAVVQALGLSLADFDWFAPRYNVAPTQLAPVVRVIDGRRRIDNLKWGLIPSWANDPTIGNALINARGETVASKPSFRSAFKSRRCLVPVSGFYEWQKLDGGKRKQPYYIKSAGGEALFLAGLWERWTKGAEPIESFTIITTTPNQMMAEVHDRMPVILDPDDFSTWLSSSTAPDEASKLIKPYPSELMLRYPVSPLVNSPRNNDPSCIEPVAA